MSSLGLAGMPSPDAAKLPAMPRAQEDFGYLEMPREGWMNQETFREKVWRKTKQNPFVPIGNFTLAY